jgi:16S rRNA (cytosine1402-N4)-methyltransferase
MHDGHRSLPEGYHTPVMVEEVVSFLRPDRGGIYVDGTLGGGGHAEHILRSLSSSGKLIGFDVDADAITYAGRRLAHFGAKMSFVHGNFSTMKASLAKMSVPSVDGVLLDLGVSSHQIDDASRGFSFQQPGRLDMRMDVMQSVDAALVLNTRDEKALAEILWKYGEERHARKIASRIVALRRDRLFATSRELAEVVQSVTGKRFLAKSLARVFQAIRIVVNRELDNLRSGLRDAVDMLNPGGRIVVIAYHSLEDRIVKDAFRDESKTAIPSGSRYLPDQPHVPRLALLTRKPVVAGEDERLRNPRSRSAKLRAAERIQA